MSDRAPEPFVIIAAAGATISDREAALKHLGALLAPRVVVVLPHGWSASQDRLDRFRCAALQGLIAKWAWSGLVGDSEEVRAQYTREADEHIVKRADEIARAMLAEVEREP